MGVGEVRSTGRKERVGGDYSSTLNAGQGTQRSIRNMGSSDLILKPSCLTVFRDRSSCQMRERFPYIHVSNNISKLIV